MNYVRNYENILNFVRVMPKYYAGSIFPDAVYYKSSYLDNGLQRNFGGNGQTGNRAANVEPQSRDYSSYRPYAINNIGYILYKNVYSLDVYIRPHIRITHALSAAISLVNSSVPVLYKFSCLPAYTMLVIQSADYGEKLLYRGYTDVASDA